VGSAIPVITDDDFSNLDILIPNKKLHQKISDHMKSGYIQRQDFIDKLEYIVGD
jgi:restriction endonuclease S subunit